MTQPGSLFTLQRPDPLPTRVSRKRGAELLGLAGFETTPANIAGWPLQSILINGRATVDTAELFDEAQLRIDREHDRVSNITSAERRSA